MEEEAVWMLRPPSHHQQPTRSSRSRCVATKPRKKVKKKTKNQTNIFYFLFCFACLTHFCYVFTCQLWKQIEIKETTKESAAAATPATIQRRRRPKRRSTGVVQIDMEVVHTILPLLFSTTLVYLHNSYYYQRHSHRLLTHTPTYLLNINRLCWGFFSVNLLIVNSGGKKPTFPSRNSVFWFSWLSSNLFGL